MAQLTPEEHALQASFHNLGDFTWLVMLPTFAPQVVPEAHRHPVAGVAAGGAVQHIDATRQLPIALSHRFSLI